LCPEDRPTQSDTTDPILGTHPAYRRKDSHLATETNQLAALQAEVKQLETMTKAMNRLANSTNNRQKEAIERLDRNQERLIDGWERMRNELFEIKVAQDRLRRRVTVDTDMK